LLYRRITSIATITVALWIGTIVTVIVVVVTGARHFDPKVAFDFPPGAFNFSLGFLLGLGAASRIGVYDYLGYHDVCYIGHAAAKDGYFFKVFARLHPSEGFPHVSLVVLGVLSILAGLVSLGTVIDALITTRILVQFIGQIGAVTLLRRRAPDLPRPFRMWLY